jgi:ABC-2 type transport system ATP-binding protein
MTSSRTIDARSLGKRFGDVTAVRDVTFSVDRGQILGLLGPNGAGKTTTVRMLTTLTSIDEGSATIAGHDVTTDPEAARRVIGLAGQAAAVDEKLTTTENLELFGRLYKLTTKQRRTKSSELVDRFDLTEFAGRPVSTLSGGQRRRLDIAVALVAEPMALFLDEPTTGLDPQSRSEVWSAVRDLADRGTAIVLTTQYLEEADRLADQILIIDQGQPIAAGSPEDLKRGAGQDVLEIHFSTREDLAAAQAALPRTTPLPADDEGRRLDIPVVEGTVQSLDLLRRIEEAGASIKDFQLRRPTLDDVFLAVTGRATTPTDGANR